MRSPFLDKCKVLFRKDIVINIYIILDINVFALHQKYHLPTTKVYLPQRVIVKIMLDKAKKVL